MDSSAERFRWNASDQKGNGSFFNKEDSNTKLINEEELDLGDTVPCDSSSKETSFYFEGVRFSPRVIEFIDAFEGKQFSVKIKIQNVGIKPVLVKIGEPNSFVSKVGALLFTERKLDDSPRHLKPGTRKRKNLQRLSFAIGASFFPWLFLSFF